MANIPLKTLKIPDKPDNVYSVPQLANEFNRQTTYVVGDYVYHNGANLYRCIVGHDKMPWDPAHFQLIKVTDDLKTKASKSELATKANKSEVEAALRNKQDILEFDDSPTAGSSNPATSGGIASALSNIDISKADNLFYDTDTNMLYLMSNGEIISDGIEIKGGGGGGGGSSFIMTFKTLSDRTISVSEGMQVPIQLLYTSVDEDGVSDGPGTATISVGGVAVKTLSIPQTPNPAAPYVVNVADYLALGSNSVRIKVVNSEGSNRTLTFTVVVLALSVKSTFKDLDVYTGNVDFYYTVTGSGTKTVHFIMDDVEIGTEEVTTSGRSRIYTIPAQAKGSHIFKCYATITSGGVEARSNELVYGMLWPDPLGIDPVVSSSFKMDSVVEGTIISIDYLVYDPLSDIATINLDVFSEEGLLYNRTTITVDRTVHTWSLSDYPFGATKFVISCRTASWETTINVEEYEFPIEPVTTALELYFNPAGRNNSAADHDQWSYQSPTTLYEAEFSGFGWNSADGWLTDENSVPILRFVPGDFMTIPIKPFDGDARNTGYTIECEIATKDVRNYDSIVFNCMSNGRGFEIKSQEAILRTTLSEISMQFKEDSKIRVTFAITNINQDHFIYIYINAIMCQCIQYSDSDYASQNPPVGFTIGAEACSIDLYSIRCYKQCLTSRGQLDNYICDLPTLGAKLEAYERNDIMNESEEIVPAMLPVELPYLIMEMPRLSQNKKDKIPGCHVSFVDKVDTSKSFEADGVEIAVQGTSSAAYPVKNEKLKFKGGFEIGGEHATKYKLFDNSIPASIFTIKVDYASSESANNVELVQLYEENDPYKDAAQIVDPRVRKGVQGRPIALFWKCTDTSSPDYNKVQFIGKGNLNHDKDALEVFGFTDDFPIAECWEFLNNPADRSLFKVSNFDERLPAPDPDNPDYEYMWQYDFEARQPDGFTDITNFRRMHEWVSAHNRDNAETEEEKQAMLEDFAADFEEYFAKDAMIFYYVFTETFLMVDNRAKNMFLTTFDGDIWFPFQYDMDTAIGINNEGTLSYTYSLEDTDRVDGKVLPHDVPTFDSEESYAIGDYVYYNDILYKCREAHTGAWNLSHFTAVELSNVFNGQDSVLWKNVRDAFGNDIRAMYQDLRKAVGTTFSYEHVRDVFLSHQAVWPEALWNEDAYLKYITPLFSTPPENQLKMLQGSKESQRDWWLFNAFRYRDSKYHIGDALSNIITLRCYGSGDVKITPYSDIYAYVQYGSNTVSKRAFRNTEVTLENPLAQMTDLEVYIYSADRIAGIGDLSQLMINYAQFGAAIKLQKLKIGDDSDGYANAVFEGLEVGNNKLLKELDISNCVECSTSIDVHQCTGLEIFKAGNTKITGVNLPNGGHLKTLILPNTITQLIIQNQADLENYICAGYGNLETLRIENTPGIPYEELINSTTNLHRVRLIGFEWESEGEEELQSAIDILETCIGIDASGQETSKAVLDGTIYIDTISADLLEEILSEYPNVKIVSGGVVNYLVKFLAYDASVLYSEVVLEGEAAIDPVTAGYIEAPTKPNTDEVHYVFDDWNEDISNIQSNLLVTPGFANSYRVRFYNYDMTLLETDYVTEGGTAVYSGLTPTKPSTAEHSYVFNGWNAALTDISEPTDFVAQYTETIRTYTVRFINGNAILQTDVVNYGSSVSYRGATPTYYDPTHAEDYDFIGWSQSTSRVIDDMDVYAVWRYNKSLTLAYLTNRLSVLENSEVSKLRDYAFYSRGISSVSLPNCRSIGSNCFYNCSHLSEVSFPLCSFVGTSAFGAGKLRYAYLPECSFVASQAFTNNEYLASLNIDKCEYIGSSAFYRCYSLPELNARMCSYIGGEAFRQCSSLERVYLDSILSVNDAAFYDCKKLSIVSMPLVESISGNAFVNCKIRELYLSKCMTINANAFSNNTALSIVSLPDIGTIGSSAFAYCSSLMSIYLLGNRVFTLNLNTRCPGTPMVNSSYTGTFGSVIVLESMYSRFEVFVTPSERLSIYNGID